MSSTALQIKDTDNFNDIAKLTGQQVNTTQSFLARLTINRDFSTEDNKAIPPGTYKVEGNEQPAVYFKTLQFRPYMNSFQYAKYNAETNKFVNKSVLFKSWSDEAIDELGGIKCGKIPNKKAINLTPEQAAIQKTIKCYRFLYGTVTGTGTDADGKDVELNEYPVLWRSTGSAFQPVGDALDILTKAQRPSFTHQFELGLKREKQGSNVYFIPVLKVDLRTYRTIQDVDMELLVKFQDTLNFENVAVIEKYKKAKGMAEIDNLAGEINEAGFIDINNGMTNDEIPF